MQGVKKLLALVACGVAMTAGTAQAADVESNGGLVYAAAEGEANNVRIVPDGTEWVVTDTGAPLTAGAGCRAEGGAVRCAKGAQVNVMLGDGDDSADVTGFADGFPSRVDGEAGNDTIVAGSTALIIGGDGNDVLTGSPVPDQIDGGNGDDQIHARGGGADMIDCGDGVDTIEIDAGDTGPTRDGCEGGALQPPALRVGHAKLRGRNLIVNVKCSKADCFGKVRPLFLAELSARGRKVKLGLKAKSFMLMGGRTSTTVTWRLTRKRAAAARRVLRHGAELYLRGALSDSVGHSSSGVSNYDI